MAARRFSPKDKDEVLDYSVDWSRLLGSNTISTFQWQVFAEDDQSNLTSSANEIVEDCN